MPYSWIKKTLDNLEQANLLRILRQTDSASGPYVTIDNRRLINFASNNYLDLANHPAIVSAVKDAADTWGWGAGASQLLVGNTSMHNQLCTKLANFEGTEDCVLFPTGYQANLGTITALVRNTDRVIMDKRCHASIIDGARLSGAEVRAYAHLSTARLERLLAKNCSGRTLVITDSVFSMDGDCAPLAEICDLCEAYKAALLVDEAHATGLLGESGSGAIEMYDLKKKPIIRLGTLSKALGGIGGFVAASGEVCRLLRNQARSAIYTTALPPVAAAAALAALELVEQEPWRREKALGLASLLRKELKLPEAPSAIVPLVVGEAEEALAVARRLLEAGILAPAIRPPTVPVKTARIRFSPTAGHTEEDIRKVVDEVRELL